MVTRFIRLLFCVVLFACAQIGAHASTLVFDFENGLNGLTQEGEDEFIVISGLTPSYETGPLGGANGTNTYAYLEASQSYFAGDTAILQLSDVQASSIEFYYHMFGHHIGTLYVDVFHNNQWHTVFSQSGQVQIDSADAWDKATVSLSDYTGEIDIRFRAVALGGWAGDIAIDQITVQTYSVTLIDFESGLEGLTQEADDEFTLISGLTPSWETGPFGGADGSSTYAYLESSQSYFAGDTAILQLSDIYASSIEFYYHMFGHHIGTLNVEVFYAGQWHTVFSQTGQFQSATEDAWELASVSLENYPGYIDIRFVAIAAGGWAGDIAIDQISYVSGAIDNSVHVDFEDSLGEASNTGDFSFLLNTGATSTSNTGPSSGANGTAGYAFVESSGGSANSAGDTAYLEIENPNSDFVHFYYHMYGPDIGTLAVDTYESGSWTRVWDISGQQHESPTDNWTTVSVYIKDASKIRFVTIAAGGYSGDIAVDEISLNPVSASNTTYIDFEANFGGMTNTSEFDFSLNTGETSTGSTGPATGANETLGYVYLETSYGAANDAGDTGYLEYQYVDDEAMMFSYHMYGEHMGTLAVEKYIDGDWLRIWEKSGSQHVSPNDDWSTAVVDVSNAAKVRFAGIAAGNYSGDMAIDEVIFSPVGYSLSSTANGTVSYAASPNVTYESGSGYEFYFCAYDDDGLKGQIEYFIEGVTDDWQVVDVSQSCLTLNLGELATGNYTIEIRYTDVLGNVNNAIKSFDVERQGYGQGTAYDWNQTGGSVSDVALNSVSVNTDDMVGTLPGNAGVSGGQAVYSIPIQTPPGRAGMQPNLSLEYNSSSSVGVMGSGWSISGLSSITRCGSTVTHDGVYKPVQLNAEDHLCLDGTRLMHHSGNAYGTSGAKYRLESGGLVFVEQTSGSLGGTSNLSFKVYTSSGVNYYGSNNATNVRADGQSKAYSWLLYERRDPSENNRITYSYSQYGSGEYLLDYVQYTHNGTLSEGIQFVHFDYESRPDRSLSYNQGGKFERTQRLTDVRTESNNTYFLNYKLDYGNVSPATGSSLVRSVELCHIPTNECLPATTFDYHDDAPTFELQDSPYDYSGDEPTQIVKLRQIKDVDGDGRKDFQAYQVDFDLVNGSGSGTSKLISMDTDGTVDWEIDVEGTEDWIYEEESWGNTRVPTQLSDSAFDINHDGINDYVSKSSGNIYSLTVSSGQVIKQSIVQYPVADGLIKSIKDFNNDGLYDLLISRDDNNDNERVFAVVYNTGTAQTPIFNASGYQHIGTFGHYVHPQNFQISQDTQLGGLRDIDSDGWLDVLLTEEECNEQTTKTTYLSNNNGSFNSVSYASLNLDLYHPRDTYHVWSDINGDGLEDYVFVPNNQSSASKTWHYQLNTGGSYADAVDTGSTTGLVNVELKWEASACSPVEDKYIPKLSKGFKFEDFDGNGVTDIILPTSEVPVARYCKLEISSVNGGARGSLDPESPIFDVFEYCAYTPGPDGELYDTLRGGHDNSVYNFRVYEWVLLSDGTFTLENANQQDLLLDMRTTGTDLNGDGLMDYHLDLKGNPTTSSLLEWDDSSAPSSLQDAQPDIYLNKGSGNSTFNDVDVLASVTNGLDVQNAWTYAPLSSDADRTGGIDFYDVPDVSEIRYIDDEHIYFASSMRVVASFTQQNALNQNYDIEYSYREAVYNTQGRGIRGFRNIITHNTLTGHVTDVQFMQKFPYSSRVDESNQYVSVSDYFSNEPISQTINVWDAKQSLGAYSVFLAQSDTYAWDENATKTTANAKSHTSTSVDSGDVDIYGQSSLVSKSNTTRFRTTDDGEAYTLTESSEISTDYTILDNHAWKQVNESSVTQFAVSRQSGDPMRDAATSVDGAKTVTTTMLYENTLHPLLSTKVTIDTSDTSDVLNKQVQTAYNNYGLPTSVTETAKIYKNNNWNISQSRTTTLAYTLNGSDIASNGYLLAKTTNTKNQSSTSEYDMRLGKETLQTDINGNSTSMDYDWRGNLIYSHAQGQSPSYSAMQFPDADAPSDAAYQYYVVDAAGGESVQYFNKFGMLLRTKTKGFDGSSIFVNKVYNEKNLVHFESTPSFSVNNTSGSYYEYDDLLRVINKQTDQTDGQVLNVNYIHSGHSTTIEASDLPDMSRTYDVAGRLIKTVDAMNGVTRYAYDGMSNPIVIRDALGNDIVAQYNGFGHKLYVNDPNMGRSDFIYNGFGELQQETDANNDVISYLYDGLGRLVTRTTAHNSNSLSNSTATFTYDTAPNGIGLLASETENNLSKYYAYDNYSRVSEVTQVINGQSHVIKHQYDGNSGRPKMLVYPNDLRVAYEYNDYGYLHKIKNAASGYVYQEVTDHDAFGNITGDKMTNGLIESTRIYDAVTGQMRLSQASKGNTVLHHIDYSQFGAYDEFGNLTERHDVMLGEQFEYQYDDLHRLTQFSGDIGIGGVQSIDYTYDALGNMLSKSDFASSYSYSNGTSGGPNAVKEVTLLNGSKVSYGYDDKGQMIQGKGFNNALYTAFGKLADITRNGTQMQFEYGPNRARYIQYKGSESTTYIDKLLELDNNGDWRAYIGSVAIVAYSQDKGSHITFTHKERLGSSATMTDHNGTVVSRRSFDPFGRPNNSAGTLNSWQRDLNTRGFTDHEHLDDIELIHMNGRVYDYNLGRFTSVDPFIQGNGTSQGINPYSYVMNNPLSYTDPTGYNSASVCKDEGSKECGPPDDSGAGEGKSDETKGKERVKVPYTGRPRAMGMPWKTVHSSGGSNNQDNGASSSIGDGAKGKAKDDDVSEIDDKDKSNAAGSAEGAGKNKTPSFKLKTTKTMDDFTLMDEIDEIAEGASIVIGYFVDVGPEHRDFDENSIQSFRLSQTPEFERIRKLFFKLYGEKLSGVSDWTGISATGFGKTISFWEGLKISWESPTGAYVGTFAVTQITGGPDRTLTYTLTNNTNLTSLTGRLFGELPYERIEGKWRPMSEVSQTYIVKEQYELE